MPLDTRHIKYIVIGGSAGSFRIITKILTALPEDFPLPIILSLHRLKHVRTGFVEALALKSKMQIEEPYDKQHIKSNKVYLAPANYHLLVELGNHFALSTAENVNHSRPSIDLSFESAGFVFKQKMLGILLSGANKDGAKGMLQAKLRGALTVVQDPKECQAKTMPTAAIATGKMDEIMNSDRIIQLLMKIYRERKKINP